MTKVILFLLSFIATTGYSYGFDLNDCIINGMKGVSSDVAARQVRYACDQKKKTYQENRLEQLRKKYGEQLENDILQDAEFFEKEGAGFHSFRYTNKSIDKTVTFIRLEVIPAPGGAGTDCEFTSRRVHAYTVTMKPGATLKLLYPVSASANCLKPLVVLGRQPSWKDLSYSSAVKPVEKDPFLNLE